MRISCRPLRPLVLAVALAAGGADAQPFADPGTGVGALGGISEGSDSAGSSFFATALGLTRLTGAVGVELAAGYRQDRYTGQSSDGSHELKVREIPVQLSLLFYLLPNARVQPYLLGGGGFYWVDVQDLGRDGVISVSSSQFGLHVGAGVDVRVATRLSLRADGRYVFLDVGAVTSLGEKADYWQAGIGFNLYF
jgi:outer membrane protein W